MSLGPDEIPILSIQMTAPLDGTTTLISSPDALTRSSSASSAYSTRTLATSKGSLSNYHMSNGVGFPPSPHINSIYQNQAIVSSGPYVSHRHACTRIGARTCSTTRLTKMRVLGVEMRVRSVSGNLRNPVRGVKPSCGF